MDRKSERALTGVSRYRAVNLSGLWSFCGAWAIFAATGLWLAAAGYVVFSAAMGVLALFLTAVFVGLAVCVRRELLPPDLDEIPQPRYWLSREHYGEYKARIADMLYQLAALRVLLVATFNLESLVHQQWCVWASMVLFVVGCPAVIIGYHVRLNRLARRRVEKH